MPTQDICGIYMINNIKNNQKYIGLSKHCNRRFREHRRMLRSGKHPNCHLQAAWNKNGEGSFVFKIIEECKQADLADREIYWIEYYNSFHNGYNRSGGGDGTIKAIYSPERNAKISAFLTGRKRDEISGERNHKARAIYCLNNNRRFACVKYAAQEYGIHYEGVIRSCELHCTVGNEMYIFAYEEDYLRLGKEDIKRIIEDAIYARKHPKKPNSIVCLNTKDVLNSALEAANKYGLSCINGILKCCRGEIKFCGQDNNYNPLVWVYNDEYVHMTGQEITNRLADAKKSAIHRYKVLCVETGEVFNSAKEAARAFGISNVTLSCKLRTIGEYKLSRFNNEITLKIA